RTTLRLQEPIAGSAPLFQDCYLQWMAQLQRVEPSARGPPISRLSERRPVFFPVIYRSGRAAFGGIGGRPRFPRARRRDSMPTDRKPRTAMSTQTIIVERRGRVGIVRLNRPQALNALNVTLKNELLGAVEALDADANVGCILMTGSDKAFAAGADIKEMADQTYIDIFRADYPADYERLARVRKPIIAAVAGFALGGGCELAMMCDLIIAADNAKFGQPEIKLGVIPGIGGTQRLARAVGKAKAMDLILTGRMMDAAEAERSGLVARVVPAASLMEEAMKVAETIAAMSQPSLIAAKEAVNRSFETSLAEGVRFERRVFHALFATKDRKEGMAAFIEKRPPRSRNDDGCGRRASLVFKPGRSSRGAKPSFPPMRAKSGEGPSMLRGGEPKRYPRHIVLREIGGPGQQALKRARVLVIGAGGLGAPALLFLAAARGGALRGIHGDAGALPDLQRHGIHGTAQMRGAGAVGGPRA